MPIKFRRLTEIKKSLVIELMNHPMVYKHLPLLNLPFNDDNYESFIESKEQIWKEYKFGPYAFTYEDVFIGWGGLQPETNDVEIAMILHPNYWGIGKTLYKKIINIAFNEMGLNSITVLFPPSRTHIKGLLVLGFKKETEILIAGKLFIKYRLKKYPLS
jgi:RimJ/RimL family protein N-acetyltransferase